MAPEASLIFYSNFVLMLRYIKGKQLLLTSEEVTSTYKGNLMQLVMKNKSVIIYLLQPCVKGRNV